MENKSRWIDHGLEFRTNKLFHVIFYKWDTSHFIFYIFIFIYKKEEFIFKRTVKFCHFFFFFILFPTLSGRIMEHLKRPPPTFSSLLYSVSSLCLVQGEAAFLLYSVSSFQLMQVKRCISYFIKLYCAYERLQRYLHYFHSNKGSFKMNKVNGFTTTYMTFHGDLFYDA